MSYILDSLLRGHCLADWTGIARGLRVFLHFGKECPFNFLMFALLFPGAATGAFASSDLLWCRSASHFAHSLFLPPSLWLTFFSLFTSLQDREGRENYKSSGASIKEKTCSRKHAVTNNWALYRYGGSNDSFVILSVMRPLIEEDACFVLCGLCVCTETWVHRPLKHYCFSAESRIMMLM